MRDRILEIVVFLMDYMRDNQDRLSETDDFSTTLRTMGYADNEISSAYFWLMNRFGSTPEQLFADFPAVHGSCRILSDNERMVLSTDAYGFLLKLQNLSLIDDEQFETILERVAVFGTEPVSIDQVKVISSSIVFTGFEDFEAIEALTSGNDTRLVN